MLSPNFEREEPMLWLSMVAKWGNYIVLEIGVGFPVLCQKSVFARHSGARDPSQAQDDDALLAPTCKTM